MGEYESGIQNGRVEGLFEKLVITNSRNESNVNEKSLNR